LPIGILKGNPKMELRREIPALICELLPAHGCVIIPGLGGFITHYKPAVIQASSGKILPPAAETGFNPALRTNDGLLAQALSHKTGMPYATALEKVQEFSWNCLASLNMDQEVHFKGLGTLRLDEYKNFRFEPDKHANLLDDAFGLAPVNALPLKHPTKPIQHKDRRPERAAGIKGKHIMEGLRWTVMIMPLILLAFYSVYQTGVLEGLVSYSSFSGIAGSENNKTQETPVPLTPDEKLRESYFAEIHWPAPITTETETRPPSDTTLPVIVFKSDIRPRQDVKAQPQVNTTEPVVNKNEEPSVARQTQNIEEAKPKTDKDIKNKYHLIIGCFKERANAERLIKELRIKGITAFEAGTTPSGLTRVSVGAYASRAEAEQARQEISKESLPEIWIGKL
jgi:cell division septation protein DedD